MDDIGRLIEIAGARDAVPVERTERVRQNVRAHWQQVVADQAATGQTTGPVTRRVGRFNVMAIAAGLVLTLGVSFTLWNYYAAPDLQALASVDRVLGDVQIQNKTARTGSTINAGTPIVTADNGRIALRLSAGQSLRVDAASRVILHSPRHISLEAGAIYIDSEFATGEDPILVSTPLGTARDIGTQFQVRVSELLLVVGVRTGLVEVSQTGQKSLSVNRGNYVKLDASGDSEQHPLSPDDPDWDWIETIAPGFDIQGASLAQYLQWFAQERGVQLVWADTASESRAGTAMLSGSIEGTSLIEGLSLVKQVAPFEYRLSAETLWVKVE